MDSTHANSSRCYVCGRTLEECHNYMKQLIDNNIESFIEKYKQGNLGNKRLDEAKSRALRNEKINKNMPLFKTLMSRYEGMSPAAYLDRLTEIRDEHKAPHTNLKRDERSMEEVQLEVMLLSFLILKRCTYLKEKYGSWNSEKYRIAVELNYAFEGNESEDLRTFFGLNPGGKSVGEIIDSRQQAISEFFRVYDLNDERSDPWSEFRETIREELILREEVKMSTVRCGHLDVPICSVCMGAIRAVSPSY